MSAYAVAAQDVAGPLALAARRHGREALGAGDAETGFDAAFTDSANEAVSTPARTSDFAATTGAAKGSSPASAESREPLPDDAGASPATGSKAEAGTAPIDWRNQLAMFADKTVDSSLSDEKPANSASRSAAKADETSAPTTAATPVSASAATPAPTTAATVAPSGPAVTAATPDATQDLSAPANPDSAGSTRDIPTSPRSADPSYSTSDSVKAALPPPAQAPLQDAPFSSLQTLLKNFTSASPAPAESASGGARAQTPPSRASSTDPASAKSASLSDAKTRVLTASTLAKEAPLSAPRAAADPILASFMAAPRSATKATAGAPTTGAAQHSSPTTSVRAEKPNAECAPTAPAPAIDAAAPAPAAAVALVPAAVPTIAPTPTSTFSSPTNDDDQDAVALIGAALASTAGAPAAPTGSSKLAAVPSRAAVGADPPFAAADISAPAVHVVAQQTWLQPVSPNFSPGLNRVAAADRDALDIPHAQATSAKSAKADEAKNAAAPSSVAAAPQADLPAALRTPVSAAEVWATGSAAGTNQPNGATSAGATAVAAAPTAQGPAATPLAATPRRDLEITLEPAELGGLQVKMKSAGDRLEIAFVADKGETARMISDKSATLESQLQGAGIGLGGIDISSAGKQAGGAEWTSSTGGAAANGAGAGAGDDSASTGQRQATTGRNRQDQANEQGDATRDTRPQGGGRGLYL